MRICISIAARTTEEALVKIAKAEALADVIEVRLDLMASWDIRRIVSSTWRPILATYRSRCEGGEGAGGDRNAARCLREAIEAGAHYVDVEWRMAPHHRQAILQHPGSSHTILSVHILDRTPGDRRLHGLLDKMMDVGAHVVKIIPWAVRWEDNLRILDLIRRARAAQREIIAFCGGPMGRFSRVFSPFLGGHMTFAALERGEESAPGQTAARDLRQIWGMLLP